MSGIGPVTGTTGRLQDVNGPLWALICAGTGGAPTANREYLFRFSVAAPILASVFRYGVQTQSGNLVGCIRDASGNKLLTTGSVACAVAGSAEAAFTASAWLYPGRYYWLSITPDNATVRFMVASSASGGAGLFSESCAISSGSYPPAASVTITPAAVSGGLLMGLTFR